MRFDIKNEAHRKKLRSELAFYSLASDYNGAGKFLHIPEDYVTEGGFPLGRICKRLRDDCQQGRLDADDIRFLLELRMPLTDSPKKNLRTWLDRADDAEAYYNKHGTLSMPSAELFPDGASMFQWVHHQKKLQKRGELSEYQKARLEKMGIRWIRPKRLAGWELGYRHAEEFFEANGHLFVPKKHASPDGFPLGRWIHEQRDRYLGLSPYKISDERIDMLEEIGMFWEDVEQAEWDWFVGLLRECIRKTKKPFVMDKNYRYENYPLGERVGQAIRQYADGGLSAERERDLRKAGFKFDRVIR